MPKRLTDTPEIESGSVDPVEDVVAEEARRVARRHAEKVAQAEEDTRVYAELCKPFDKTFERVVGGVNLTYITGEQVVSRLNEVLGPAAWSWNVEKENTRIQEDEAQVMGTLSVTFPSAADYYGRTSEKVGFGGAKIKRYGAQTRNPNSPISIGNDFKSADTDAFKKAAAKFGVGLYLSQRDGERDLPENTASGTYQAPASTNRTVSFPKSAGTSTTGPIERKSPTGIMIGGVWYNQSKYSPVDLALYNEGDTVTVTHKEGRTFIDGIMALGGPPVESEPEADF